MAVSSMEASAANATMRIAAALRSANGLCPLNISMRSRENAIHSHAAPATSRPPASESNTGRVATPAIAASSTQSATDWIPSRAATTERHGGGRTRPVARAIASPTPQKPQKARSPTTSTSAGW